MTTKNQNFSSFNFDDLDKHLTDLVHKLPSEFYQTLKTKLMETNLFSKGNTIQIELVVDTNILFSEVRSLMLNNSSFLLKIADNPFIELHAPREIKTELYEKIKQKFPKEAKTRNLDLIICKQKADELLSKIKLFDQVTEEGYKRALNQMADRDRDDVSFLALHFSIKSHGVLTKDDKHFSKQKETKLWKLNEAGQVLTIIEKGVFSFYVSSISLQILFDFLYAVVSAIWAIIIEIIEGFIKVFIAILQGSIEGIKKLPPGLLGVVGIGLLLILFVDNLRQGARDIMIVIWDKIKEFIIWIIELFKIILEIFKNISESLIPYVQVSLELLNYLINNSNKAIIQLNELEASRPT